MPERADEVQEIRQILRDNKFRATPARIAVLQKLRAATSPLTHAELSDMLVPLGFDKATVFRNLTDLTEAGLVSRTELGDHVWRFEILDEDAHGEKHPHFVCTDCGDVSCLGTMKFTANSKQKASVIGRISEILIKGLCVECASGAA